MIKYIDIEEFMNEGFLQEANRQFFHPLGLALEAKMEDGAPPQELWIWDYREDGEGVRYSEEVLASSVAKERAARVRKARALHAPARLQLWGAVIQPLGRGR